MKLRVAARFANEQTASVYANLHLNEKQCFVNLNIVNTLIFIFTIFCDISVRVLIESWLSKLIKELSIDAKFRNVSS